VSGTFTYGGLKASSNLQLCESVESQLTSLSESAASLDVLPCSMHDGDHYLERVPAREVDKDRSKTPTDDRGKQINVIL
jgi:hypothetical protein